MQKRSVIDTTDRVVPVAATDQVVLLVAMVPADRRAVTDPVGLPVAGTAATVLRDHRGHQVPPDTAAFDVHDVLPDHPAVTVPADLPAAGTAAMAPADHQAAMAPAAAAVLPAVTVPVAAVDLQAL